MNRSALFGLLAILVLMLPGTPASPAGKDDKDKVTLTVKAKCEAEGVSEGPDFSLKDHIIVTLNETNTYRIVFFDDVEGAQLELLSHKTTISAEGGGAFKSSGESRSWSYSAKRGSPSNAICGLRLSLIQGKGRVHLGNFVDSGDIKASDELALCTGLGFARMGIISLTSDNGLNGGSSQAFIEQLHYSFKPKEKSFTVTGHAGGTWEFKGDDGSGTANLQVDYTVTAGTPEILEAVIIPKGNYKAWLPMASGQGAQKPGNDISFTVELRNSEGGKAKEKTAMFEFELVDSSREVGTCMNSPWTDCEPDLRIERKNNSSLAEVSGDGQTAKTSKGLKSTSITVSCFDGAASGKLRVLAHIDGEDDVLTAHLEDQPDLTEVAIPYDTDNNKVADAWEKDNDTFGKSLKTDEDEEPQGDRHNGDGLTIWEEYRGFIVDRQFVRTDPKKKDFFACDNVGGKTQMALNRFEALSKLKVHGKLKIDELGTSRIINRNRSSEDAHVVDQHGVLITTWSSDGICRAEGGPGTPKSITEVLIDSTLRDTMTKKISPTNTRTFPYFIPTVAHELLHCCNVWHHGECDTIVYWKAETVDGVTSLYEYSKAADCGHPDKGKPIKAYVEHSEGVYPATDPFWSIPLIVWLGQKHGQHSGVEDCVMRYDCSTAAVRNANSRYDYLTEDQEPVGQGICTIGSGTGVNAEGRAPISRYKDAAADRGNCADQICVNDLYH